MNDYGEVFKIQLDLPRKKEERFLRTSLSIKLLKVLCQKAMQVREFHV